MCHMHEDRPSGGVQYEHLLVLTLTNGEQTLLENLLCCNGIGLSVAVLGTLFVQHHTQHQCRNNIKEFKEKNIKHVKLRRRFTIQSPYKNHSVCPHNESYETYLMYKTKVGATQFCFFFSMF